MARIGGNSSNPKEILIKGNFFHVKFLKFHFFLELCKLNFRSNSGLNHPI